MPTTRKKNNANALPSLPAIALRRLNKRCDDAGERLTPARVNAYTELYLANRPLSAYDLLGRLSQREQRQIAPLTVYRQLDFLIRVGVVHRIASTQTFLACEHPDHNHVWLYLLCSHCGQADELESAEVSTALDSAASTRGFKVHKQIVELEGLCRKCSSETTNHPAHHKH